MINIPVAVILVGMLPLTSALADENPGATNDQLVLQDLERNQSLLETLVEGGVRLASTDDPFRRAAMYNDLVQTLVQELRRALDARDEPRAVEVGTHLRALLQRGVAGSLKACHQHVGMTQDKKAEMERIAARTSVLLDPLEQLLPGMPSTGQDALKRTLQALHDAHLDVKHAASP